MSGISDDAWMDGVSDQAAGAGSRLADNVLHFTRLLRRAGLRLGVASALDALAAAAAVDVTRRDQLYWALHAVLVQRPEDAELFAQAFQLFWRDPLAGGAGLGLRAEMLAQSRLVRPPAVGRRVAEAWHPPVPTAAPPPERLELDAALTFAADEVLRRRDFEQMTADELARARRAAAGMVAALRPVATRRTAPDPHGRRIDLPRTLAASRQTGGDLALLRFRARRRQPPPVVALCDISGSMGRYSDVLLRFLHALAAGGTRVHAFLFATRLTDVTRLLRRRDADQALERCGRQVQDWGGGTRLRACLREFNRAWARRVAAGAVVLLVTDGLDRDPEPGLDAEAARLRRSCRRLVWLNPLLRWSGFAPRAQGIRALLPHVHEHRPVHNLDSLEELARALGAGSKLNSQARRAAGKVR